MAYKMNFRMLKNKLIAVLVLGALAFSCDDFGSTNVDPNVPSAAETSLLLTGAQQYIVSYIYDEVTPIYYVQHVSSTQYASGSRYETSEFSNYSWYRSPLADLQLIIDLNTDEETKTAALSGGSNENQLAVARILKAYYFQVMTDAWGYIPYSEALQGTDNFTPAYDSQEDIYADLINELKEAAALISSANPVRGDILFDGDMAKWKAFANTLRLNMALRLSEVAPSTAATEFAAAASADGGLITEDVTYTFLSESANDNPWYDRYLTRIDYAISEPLLDFMNANSDPRIPVYADPAASTGTYVGMPYGITDADAGAIPYDAVSLIGSSLREQSSPGYLFTVSQVNFALAEGVHRGWISGTASDYYNAAIQASFEQYGVFDQATYDAYIAQAGVAWVDADAYQLIGEQKWVALYLNGFESWSEMRRLDYPVLSPAPEAAAGQGIPTKYPYVATEDGELNAENYEAAVTAQGGNTLSTKVWWDAN